MRKPKEERKESNTIPFVEGIKRTTKRIKRKKTKMGQLVIRIGSV